MVERYHLTLAALALLAGVVVAGADRFAPAGVGRRAVAVAAATGAVLGGWGNPRSWPWWVAAAVALVVADRPDRPHPLGRWTVALTVVSLVGVWSAVPDTEPPLAAGAALVPVAVVRAWRGVVVGPAGSVALVVAVLGATWVGSAGWGAALATACAVGVVAVAPVVLGVGRVLVGQQLMVLGGAHCIVALALPRSIMGLPAGIAAAIAVAELVLLGLLCVVVTRQDPAEV